MDVAVDELPTHALTLWQPWAWLVARGIKTIENRPWGFQQKSFRGWFWVHAGVRNQRREREDWDFAYGAIIGRAMITDVVFPRGTLFHPREPVPWHFPDQFGFRVERAVMLAVPVPCRGYQQFWRVPETVQRELRSAA